MTSEEEPVHVTEDTEIFGAVLMEYGGGIAEWVENSSTVGFGPYLAKLHIPPGAPSGVTCEAYVGVDNIIPTLNDIDKLEAKYFSLPGSTSMWTPYFCICFDLDGDGLGCDEIIIGYDNTVLDNKTDGTKKNQWNILTADYWQIISHGYEVSYTFDELKEILGDERIMRIRVSVDSRYDDNNWLIYVDGLTINDTVYNLEPAKPLPQDN
ncbi:MAG: hypothetical protein JSU58_08780 [Dehalococcoidales bacterium]|nr:MAG: hypothetical protein JSU58_08780 [Dehalococcoidales bacterium]